MTPSLRRARPDVFKLQTDASLSQATPTSGTKYTVLDTVKNVRIIGIVASVTWTGQPTPLEIHVTIDGQAYTFTVTDPVSATKYYARLLSGNAITAQPLVTTDVEVTRAFLLEGRSVKVEAETTGGTVSNLSATVKYANK